MRQQCQRFRLLMWLQFLSRLAVLSFRATYECTGSQDYGCNIVHMEALQLPSLSLSDTQRTLKAEPIDLLMSQQRACAITVNERYNISRPKRSCQKATQLI